MTKILQDGSPVSGPACSAALDCLSNIGGVIFDELPVSPEKYSLRSSRLRLAGGRGGGGRGREMERSGSERRSHKENAAHGRARQTKPPASQAIGNKSLPLFNRHFSGREAIRSSYIVQLTHLNLCSQDATFCLIL